MLIKCLALLPLLAVAQGFLLPTLPASGLIFGQNFTLPEGRDTSLLILNPLLDPSRPQESRTFEWIVYRNDDYYQTGGPIFIFISDGFRGLEQLFFGHLHDIAQSLNGAIYVATHRFFLPNFVTPSTSLDNLQYLSVNYALADIAFLAEHIREDVPADTKIVAVGSGYGGSLATYARMRYPFLIDAGWSSSGYHAPERVSTNYFINLATNVLNVGGAVCFNEVYEAFRMIEENLTPQGVPFLMEELRMCSSFDTEDIHEVAHIYEALIILVTVWFYETHRAGIVQFCDAMQPPADEDVYRPTALRRFGGWLDDQYGDFMCRELSYDPNMCEMQNVAWYRQANALGFRQMIYMSCTQFGMFPSTEYIDDAYLSIFGNRIPASFSEAYCQDVLGPDFDISGLALNLENWEAQYGGLTPNVTHMIFTYGELDPYNTYGIREDLNEDAPAIEIPGYAHSGDLYPISPFDEPEIVEIKERIQEIITQWVS